MLFAALRLSANALLGVKRALGEISDDELEALRARARPGRTALRYFDQLEWN